MSYHRFELLFYEERLPECCDLALEMLYFLFRDYIYQPSLKGGWVGGGRVGVRWVDVRGEG